MDEWDVYNLQDATPSLYPILFFYYYVFITKDKIQFWSQCVFYHF